MKNRYFARIILLVLLLLIIAVMYFTINSSRSGEEVVLVVEKGDSFSDIASRLENEGVIGSALILKVRAEEKGIDRLVAPGRYVFHTGMKYEEVLEVLQRGPSAEYIKVTIPEGYNVRQISEKLHQSPGINREKFLEICLKKKAIFEDEYGFLKQNPTESLEGYLFPDTYFFEPDMSEEQIIRAMLDNFQHKIAEIPEELRKNSSLSLHEIITIASIIEKEAKLKEERALVSSVIYNRLERGMPLQMCSTVQYLLEEPRETLTEEDLKIQSPYNTYLHKGLPPGPICNPGLDSIRAAYQPADTDYLYYVLIDDSGKHFFTSSYDEFIRAKQGRE